MCWHAYKLLVLKNAQLSMRDCGGWHYICHLFAERIWCLAKLPAEQHNKIFVQSTNY